MQTRLRLLLFALAVPLLAALAASTARDRWDQRWRAGLQREFQAFGHRAGGAVMARYSLGALCGDASRAAGIPPCRTYTRLSTLVTASVGVAVLGLAWVGLLAGGAAAARRGRRRALAGFRALVWVSAGGLVVLLGTQGLLAVQAASLAAGLLPPGVRPPWLGSVAGLAGALWVGLSSAQALRTVRRLRLVPLVLARGLDETEALGVRALAARAGTAGGPRWDLVAGLAPAIFAAAGPVDTLDGRRAGPVLHVSLTLARILTVPECEGLIAAQVARLGDRQAQAASRFTSAWLRLQEEAARVRSAPALSKALVFPAAWWLAFVVDSFEPAAAAAWRGVDGEADRAAVAAAGGEAYGAALVKVHAFAPAWDAALGAMGRAAAAGEQYVSASRLFEEIVAANAEPSRVEWAVARLAGLSPDGRLVVPRAGGADLARVAAAALDVRPVAPADAVLGGAAARLDEDLTLARHLQLQ